MTYGEHRDFDEKKTVKFRCESGVHPAVSGQHGDYETQLWSHSSFSMHSTQVLLSTQLAPGRVNTRGVCEQPTLILINSFLEKHLSLRQECAETLGPQYVSENPLRHLQFKGQAVMYPPVSPGSLC